MNAADREAILVGGLAAIASNLGNGSIRPSEAARAADPLRLRASETLRNAGYAFYENAGPDRLDYWFTKKQLQALKG